MPVSSLRFTNLGPFDDISFEFDPQVNVFVGPNNCGKTTALLALAELLVDRFRLPWKLVRGESRFSVTFAGAPRRYRQLGGTYPLRHPDRGWETTEAISAVSPVLIRLGYRTFVPALRLSTDFRSEGPGAPRRKDPAQAAEDILSGGETRRLRTERRAWCVEDADIIQKIVDLDYRAYREKRSEIRTTISKIGAFASTMTEGFPVEFAGIGQDGEGLFPQFTTPDGIVPLNVLSQGTQALIQWCAHFLIGYAEFYQFPERFDDKPAILIIDEIDAHLHPSWQRQILRALTSEFPSLQVFCATHSPLTLSGLKAGQVHLLRRDANGKLTVSRNQTDIEGWSADEIYGSLLGVEPTDLATTQKLERVRKLRRREGKLTRKEKQELESLREELHQGLAGPFLADQIDVVASRLRDAARGSARSKAKKAPRKKAAKPAKRSKKKSASTARRRKR